MVYNDYLYKTLYYFLPTVHQLLVFIKMKEYWTPVQSNFTLEGTNAGSIFIRNPFVTNLVRILFIITPFEGKP